MGRVLGSKHAKPRSDAGTKRASFVTQAQRASQRVINDRHLAEAIGPASAAQRAALRARVDAQVAKLPKGWETAPETVLSLDPSVPYKG